MEDADATSGRASPLEYNDVWHDNNIDIELRHDDNWEQNLGGQILSDDGTDLLDPDAVSQQNPAPELLQLGQPGHATQQSQDGYLPFCPDSASQQQDAAATSAELHLDQQGHASQQSGDASQGEIVLIDNQSWEYKGLREWIFNELLKYRNGRSLLKVYKLNLKYSNISKRKLSTSDPAECERRAYIVDKEQDASNKGEPAEDDMNEGSSSSTQKPEPSTINMPTAKSARSFSPLPPPLVI